jgi:Protein of unknown function (DUF3147)
MKIRFNFSAIGQNKWYDYALRFAFGGAMTALAGIIAKEFGPVVGGLFLAFPAIFPASASLIEKHEKQRKERLGLSAGTRGRHAAALDAAGAVMGASALIAFALAVWKVLPNYSTALVIVFSTGLWFVISILIWRASEVF